MKYLHFNTNKNMQAVNWSINMAKNQFFFFLFLLNHFSELKYPNLDPEFLDTPVLFSFPDSREKFRKLHSLYREFMKTRLTTQRKKKK